MRSRRWFTHALTLLGCSLLSSVGCSLGAKLPEGRIRCETQSDCPSAWVCRITAPEDQGLCYRNSATDSGSADSSASEDSSVAADAGRDSATTDSSIAIDAGIDASTTDDAGRDASLDADTPNADGGSGDAATDSNVPGPDGGMGQDAGPQPTISAVSITNRYVNPGQSTTVRCFASDPESLPLTFMWSALSGSFTDVTQQFPSYTPTDLGVNDVTCTVRNSRGGTDQASDTVRVYPSGWLTLLRFSLDSNDRSGNSNDGTVTNGSYGSDRAGNTGSAISLSGDGDVTLPNESMFDLSAWSFVVTLRPTAGHGGTLIRKGQSAFGAFTVLLYADNDASLPGRLQYFQGGASSYSAVLGTYTAQADRFIHLAVTRSAGGELRTYVDGTLVDTQTNVPDAAENDAPVVFGNGPLGAFTGDLDEIQIYNRVLTPPEITALTTMQ